MRTVLVTGGAGFIGSEVAVTLLNKGFDVVILDNLSNSKETAVGRIEKITGKKPKFYKGDCCDYSMLEKVFKENKVDAVIHFAGYKAVGESVSKPLEYYKNNIGSAATVLMAMRDFNMKTFIFSSSATVYGDPEELPLVETMETKKATNPYGATKLAIEEMCEAFSVADPSATVVLLRYFNPIGAHPSGLLGEDPNDIPNNLMPYITQVAVGRLPLLHVYGDDYPTKDGTGVRDYIHVLDLAEGHVAALEKINEPGLHVYNLGTGSGSSVFDIIKAFERVNGIKIPYDIVGRRPGDIAENYADCSKAYKELGWKSRFTIEDACRDAYNFQKLNPNGIEEN